MLLDLTVSKSYVTHVSIIFDPLLLINFVLKCSRHSSSNVVLTFEANRHLGICSFTYHTRRTFARAFAVTIILRQRWRCAHATYVLPCGYQTAPKQLPENTGQESGKSSVASISNRKMVLFNKTMQCDAQFLLLIGNANAATFMLWRNSFFGVSPRERYVSVISLIAFRTPSIQFVIAQKISEFFTKVNSDTKV